MPAGTERHPVVADYPDAHVLCGHPVSLFGDREYLRAEQVLGGRSHQCFVVVAYDCVAGVGYEREPFPVTGMAGGGVGIGGAVGSGVGVAVGTGVAVGSGVGVAVGTGVGVGCGVGVVVGSGVGVAVGFGVGVGVGSGVGAAVGSGVAVVVGSGVGVAVGRGVAVGAGVGRGPTLIVSAPPTVSSTRFMSVSTPENVYEPSWSGAMTV